MSYILNIDTSLSKAIVSLSIDGNIVQLAINENQRDHATFLHPAIKSLILKEGIKMEELSAISVAVGPGSYTGIRVGMSAAKGLCFALNIPLIPIDNLFLIASACKNEMEVKKSLICSMIDARRMEVFTACYDMDLKVKVEPHSIILNENSFADEISNNEIIFCGNGVEKFQKLLLLNDSLVCNSEDNSKVMANHSDTLFKSNAFGNLKNVKPFYMKDFYNG